MNLTVSEPARSDYVASSDEGSKTVTIPVDATTATYSVATVARASRRAARFRVRVAANHGTADSETVSMTVLALPKPATGLTFSNVTGTTVDLSWTLPEQRRGGSRECG